MIRIFWNDLAFAVLTSFWSTVALIAVIVRPRTRVSCAIARIWGKMAYRACGVRLEVHGREQRFDAPAYLVMANHTSHFDAPGIYAAVPIDMRPVAKRELGKIPIFGWALVRGAAIMIDRENKREAHASIDRAAETIRRGRSVLMFPEGTRTPPGTLGPLKKGPFHLALAARVPVIPVGVVGTGEVLLPGDWRIRPGRVVIRIGAPIDTASLPDGEAGREALMSQVEAALRALTAAG